MSNKISKLAKIKVKKEKDQTKSQLQELLNEKNISVAPNQIDILVKIFKTILVGGFATLIDLIVYIVLYKLVKLNPLYSNILSILVSSIYSYIASNKYIFNKYNKNKKIKEFAINTFIGLTISELSILLLVTKLKWSAIIVKVLALILTIVLKYIARKIHREI